MHAPAAQRVESPEFRLSDTNPAIFAERQRLERSHSIIYPIIQHYRDQKITRQARRFPR